MGEDRMIREVTVGTRHGLHARPADLVARAARKYQSRIELVAASQRADGKSILELLSLAARQGTRLLVEATGPDAAAAVEAIGMLFDRNFNEQGDAEGGRDSNDSTVGSRQGCGEAG